MDFIFRFRPHPLLDGQVALHTSDAYFFRTKRQVLISAMIYFAQTFLEDFGLENYT